MPLIQRKRRADGDAEPSAQGRRWRSEPASEESAAGSDHSALEDDEDSLETGAHDQMVKKLVRLALAFEYSRHPLRRTDISAKIFPPDSRTNLKPIFEDAQKALRKTFGMELTELPLKDKVTVAQKRAAHAQANIAGTAAPVTSKAYILTSTLPPALRTSEILPPPRIPDVQSEAAFEGFVGFIVGLVYLSEGQRMSEGKLLRYLRQCNADELVLGSEKTENVLKRLERQGYLVKIKERDGAGGEENVEYVVGPRGKVEIGPQGIAAMVRSVYGKRDTELEELEDRLEASLGAGTFRRKTRKEADVQPEGETRDEEDAPAAAGPSRSRQAGRLHEETTYGRRRTRSARNTAAEPGEDEEDDD